MTSIPIILLSSSPQDCSYICMQGDFNGRQPGCASNENNEGFGNYVNVFSHNAKGIEAWCQNAR